MIIKYLQIFFKFIIISFIKIYKYFISPLLPSSCRFLPSCSDYAKEAVLEHGIIKGTIYASIRILKCNPLCEGGFDPIPKKRGKK